MSGPAPAVAVQRSGVRRELADVPPGALVLVACSGGQDSLALAAALVFVAPRAGLLAGAVVVDHGLQPGSAAVAARAAGQCRDLGLDPVVVVPVAVGAGAAVGGPEAAARAARYAALEQVAGERGAAAVLLGHTLDDQAETVLLGLARGSGARSLAGMRRRRGVLRRPFLAVRRSETLAACVAQGLVPWQDPTNGGRAAAGAEGPSTVPLRSRVRHELMPVLEAVLGPGVSEALARTADQLRDDADLLDRLADDLIAAVTVTGADARAEGGVVLDAAALEGAPTALRTRVLRTALLTAGCPGGSLQRVHVEAVDALLLDWHGQGPVALPGGVEARRRYGRLLIGVQSR